MEFTQTQTDTYELYISGEMCGLITYSGSQWCLEHFDFDDFYLDQDDLFQIATFIKNLNR